MPNWVENRITISGKPQVIYALRDFLRTEERADKSVFDFSKIVSPKDKEAYKSGEGSDGWYSWNCRNWGTKWNSCETLLEEGVIALEKQTSEPLVVGLSYSFSTAWSPPEPIIGWLVEFAQKFQCEMTWYYEEEQGWGGEVYVGSEGDTDTREWGIPSSHADHESLAKECVCCWSDDTDEWYDDCPREPRGYLSH